MSDDEISPINRKRNYVELVEDDERRGEDILEECDDEGEGIYGEAYSMESGIITEVVRKFCAYHQLIENFPSTHPKYREVLTTYDEFRRAVLHSDGKFSLDNAGDEAIIHEIEFNISVLKQILNPTDQHGSIQP